MFTNLYTFVFTLLSNSLKNAIVIFQYLTDIGVETANPLSG